MAFSFPLAGHFFSEDEGDFLSFACLLLVVCGDDDGLVVGE